MKIKSILILSVTFILLTAMKGDKSSYQFFDQKGKKAKYSTLLNEAKQADIILFGELHNNPISHWLQYELTKDLFAEIGSNLVLGAEMFEADNQLLLDEYLSGTIKNSNFEDEAKLWNNYETDYKPLVEFAKDSSLVFVCSNVPRRYAAVVNKTGFEGLENLDVEAKKFLPPFPVPYDGELEGYKSMLEMMKGMNMPHVNENLPKAQAIKDATMAYFILKNWKEGKTFLHFNGTYHSDNFEGIQWYINQYHPGLNILTISSIEQENIENLEEENLNLANFILCIPSDMTKTY